MRISGEKSDSFDDPVGLTSFPPLEHLPSRVARPGMSRRGPARPGVPPGPRRSGVLRWRTARPPAERPLRELEPQQPVELRLRVAVLEPWRFPLQNALLEIGDETSSRCQVKTDLRVLAEKSTSSHPRGAGYVTAEESPILRG